jgi:iron(III) transport system permease protein
MSAVSISAVAPRQRPQQVHWTERAGHVVLLAMGAVLGLALFAPIWMILAKSVEDKDGHFAGLANFVSYLQTPALSQSIWNSIWVSGLVTAITIPAAFVFAYALTRSCMRCRPLLRNIALIPLLAPSLLSAISFIYWFGNQGVLKAWLGERQIYGASGIVMSLVYATFPHALMILITALSLTDGRLYEAADSMGTRTLRKVFTITLPAA